ncbi:hypothetical protein [Rhodocytophaga rosea]|uniref:hypothetical protein n=1 Tax=Rhodocytophaga rosea TaxID=2704465 RepID=UPI0018D9378F|nr:hypothetical protein [Rhodocytophaga rosea]
MLSQPIITDQQFEFIKAEIDKSSLSVEQVKEDLLDHFCCTIETYLMEGLSFEAAYQKTFLQVCPGGLNEISYELFIALNFNRMISMQKLKYSLGLLLSVCISIGSLFKAMEWPGANYLLWFGLTGLVVLFLPLLAYDTYKQKDKSVIEKIKDALGFASATVLGTGIMLKIGHLTGGGILLVGGTMLFTFGFLPFLFLILYKKAIHQKFPKETLPI